MQLLLAQGWAVSWKCSLSKRHECFQGSHDSSLRKFCFLDIIVYSAVNVMKVVGNAENYKIVATESSSATA